MCPGQESPVEILFWSSVSRPGIFTITVPTGKYGGHNPEKRSMVSKKNSADHFTFLETIPDIRLTSAVGFTDIALMAKRFAIVGRCCLLLRQVNGIIMGSGYTTPGDCQADHEEYEPGKW